MYWVGEDISKRGVPSGTPRLPFPKRVAQRRGEKASTRSSPMFAASFFPLPAVLGAKVPVAGLYVSAAEGLVALSLTIVIGEVTLVTTVLLTTCDCVHT